MTSLPVSYFTVHEKTFFIPLRYVYPECEKLLAQHPQMHPLQCLQEDGCPANMQCMDFLVPRVTYMFDKVAGPAVDMMVAYFKYTRSNPGELENKVALMGAIFHRDLRAPTLMTMNPTGFAKCQAMGKVDTWVPTADFKHLGAHRGIIPVENLIHVK